MKKHAKSMKTLAESLGLTNANGLYDQRKKYPGFPAKTRWGYKIEDVRRWRAEHLGTKHSSLKQQEVRAKATQTESTDAVGYALKDRKADPLAKCEELLHLAGLMFVNAYEDGTAAPRDVEAVKKALEEARRTEAGLMELRKKRGELITLTSARGVLAKLCSRLRTTLDHYQTAVASKVIQLVDDEEYLTLDTAEQRRAFLRWSKGELREIMTLEADEVLTWLE